MSEETKLAYLQEKIKQVKMKQRYGLFAVVVGFCFLSVYIMLPIWSPPTPYAILIAITGMVFMIIGFTWYYLHYHQYNLLTNLLEKMAFKAPACSKCGKEIPNGNFAFCPFCGATLEHKQKKEEG